MLPSQPESVLLSSHAAQPVCKQENQTHHFWPFATSDFYCQQLLKVSFTIEEREKIQAKARKLLPGFTGEPPPANNQTGIDACCPLTHSAEDFNIIEGEEALGLPSGSAGRSQKQSSSLTKVYYIRQGERLGETSLGDVVVVIVAGIKQMSEQR